MPSLAGEGGAGVAWTDIVRKCIPKAQRGPLLRPDAAFGSLGAFAWGFFVTWILESEAYVFPVDYGLLFILAFVLFKASLASIAFVKEPPGKAYKDAEPFCPVSEAGA